MSHALARHLEVLKLRFPLAVGKMRQLAHDTRDGVVRRQFPFARNKSNRRPLEQFELWKTFVSHANGVASSSVEDLILVIVALCFLG
jgi:hypothetical protein